MKLYKCRPRNFCFHYIFEINLVKFSHSFMHRDECGHFSLFQAQSSRHSQCIQNIFFSEMMALDVLWKRYIPNYLFLNQVYMKKAVFFWHISRYIYIFPIFLKFLVLSHCRLGEYDRECYTFLEAFAKIKRSRSKAFWKLIRYKKTVFNSELNWCTIRLTWSEGHTDLSRVYILGQ